MFTVTRSLNWNVNRSHFVLSLVAWAGMLQFACCFYWAMSVYGGGSQIAPRMRGYSLSRNFLSDLGRRVAWSGSPNPSCLIFNISIVLLGASLLAFFIRVPDESSASPVSVRFFGVMSAIGVIGIGLTPYDRFLMAHNVALVMWLGPMVLLLVSFVVTSSIEGRAIPFARPVALTVILSIFGYAVASSHQRTVHQGTVVMQKVTAGFAIIWFLAIASPVGPVYRMSYLYVSERRRKAERQALKYMTQLERRYRKPSEPSLPRGRDVADKTSRDEAD